MARGEKQLGKGIAGSKEKEAREYLSLEKEKPARAVTELVSL